LTTFQQFRNLWAQPAEGRRLEAPLGRPNAVSCQILPNDHQQVEARRQQLLSAERFVATATNEIHLRYRRRAARPAGGGVLLLAVGVRPNGIF
jgi:hypothetical protein